ncbi:ubiquitin 3 binding protein But2 C-terminal domain-containing protein [Exophiala viscosa]|uniref:Ubiquitin 3 binding protein But2 C-terminal domain-containing protein n=1 Tax=Exophiala viscosa TaxID=2486360 RepID=A0AAN6IBQ3_9EURO|nr:ubiquitin 3 binding protein But2 C-terminal domain-containing protein [Exophiala viscosa]
MRLLLLLIAAFCGGISALPFFDAIDHAVSAVHKAIHPRQNCTCPGNLPELPDFEFPHLIIPISASNPKTAYPDTLVPNITAGDVSNIFNFDVPAERSGQTCTLEFLFPTLDQLSSSYFKLDGFGKFSFSLSAMGNGAVEGNTTYDNQPMGGDPHGFPCSKSMQPGNAYSLGSTLCVPGRISVTMSSTDSSLEWFQDYNPCPIGLYMTYSP